MKILGLTFFNILHGQNDIKPKVKAEYVLSLINTNSISDLTITAEGFEKGYSKAWLSNVSMQNGLLILTRDEYVHAWDIEDAIYFQKIGDRILIKIPHRI